MRIGESEAPTSDGVTRCRIEVQDSGSGIDPEHLQRVVEEGFTTDEAVGHQGMGLSVVQQVVKEHSGELTLESTPQEGTCVRLVLPIDPRRRNQRSKVRVVRLPGLATELLYELKTRGGDVVPIDTSEKMQGYIQQIASSREDVTVIATDESLGQQIEWLLD